MCKKTCVFFFVFVLSFLSAGVGISGATADGPIKIGLMGTFKGPLERQGIEMRDGALLALDQFQQKAKGQSFELVVANDKGDPQEAIKEAHRLIEVEKVSAIVGPFNNSCALAMAPLVSEARIPMVTLATHPALTSPLQQYVFRGNISDDVVGKVMADYTATILGGLAGDKVGLFYEDSPYGKAGMEVVGQRLKRYGIELAAVESYPSGGIDFSAQMEHFKQAGVKILIVYGTMIDAQSVMQSVIGSDLRARVLASKGWESTRLLTQVPKGLDGVIVAGYTYLLPDSLLYLGPARIWHRDPALSGQYQLVIQRETRARSRGLQLGRKECRPLRRNSSVLRNPKLRETGFASAPGPLQLAFMKVSVTVITRNESAGLRPMLESVGWADEILVIDSGSTDDTAKKLQKDWARACFSVISMTFPARRTLRNRTPRTTGS